MAKGAARSGRESAGLLLWRRRAGGPELLLVHMGGPFWARKDEGAWTVPKGLPLPDEDLLATACREFVEETGFDLPPGPFVALPPVRQAGGKRVQVFAAEGDADPARLSSNLFALEWPPRSGRLEEFPEADRAAWFDAATARSKLIVGQRPLVDAMVKLAAGAFAGDPHRGG